MEIIDKIKKKDIMVTAARDLNIERDDLIDTAFNPKADYSINIPGLSDEVNKGLSDACRRVAEDGTKNQCEALSLVDLETGAQRYYELGDYDSVGGSNYRKFIESNTTGRFAFVHNHPSTGFLSSIDMDTFVNNNQIQGMISTSNDGLKRMVFGDIKDSRFLVEIFEKEITDLRGQLKLRLFDAVDYPYEMQKMLVENAIKKFGNLGF